jgi:glutamine amidotransferase
MCRVLAYLGSPVLIDRLVVCGGCVVGRPSDRPADDAAAQSRRLRTGVVGSRSPDPARPLTYPAAGVPTFDRNLKSLASKERVSALLAHVRGVEHNPSGSAGSTT